MHTTLLYRLVIPLICICSFHSVSGKDIYNKKYKFRLTLPEQLVEVDDSARSMTGEVYYDGNAGIVMMVSARKSGFRSVNDYIDCAMKELENQLKLDYGDSTLKLLSCNKPMYFPGKTTVLRFKVAAMPNGYNTYLIYFVHHRRRDIQISFTYKLDCEQSCMAYINAIMQTLKLL